MFCSCDMSFDMCVKYDATYSDLKKYHVSCDLQILEIWFEILSVSTVPKAKIIFHNEMPATKAAQQPKQKTHETKKNYIQPVRFPAYLKHIW